MNGPKQHWFLPIVVNSRNLLFCLLFFYMAAPWWHTWWLSDVWLSPIFLRNYCISVTLNHTCEFNFRCCVSWISALPHQQKAIRRFKTTPQLFPRPLPNPRRRRGFRCVLSDRLEDPHSVARAARAWVRDCGLTGSHRTTNCQAVNWRQGRQDMTSFNVTLTKTSLRSNESIFCLRCHLSFWNQKVETMCSGMTEVNGVCIIV